jgi:hypothetical protein
LNLFKPVKGLKAFNPLFHKIKYYFLDKDGRSYYVNNAGNVDKSATPKPLELAPEGRKSLSIGFERTMTDKELGVVRSFTLPSDFVRKAGKILKSIVYTKSVSEQVFLLIQKLKVTVNLASVLFRMQYQFLYKGEIDFASFVDKDVRTSITVAEGGIAKKIKATEGNDYEFNLSSDPEAVLIKNDGINLSMTQNYLVTEGVQLESFGNGVHMIGCSATTTDGQASGFAGFDVFFDKTEVSDFDNDDRYIFITTQQINNMSVTGKLNVHAGFSNTYTVTLKSNLGQIFTLVNQALTNNTDYSFNINQTINSAPNEKWFLFGRYGTGGPGGLMNYKEGELHVSFKSRHKTTYYPAYKLSTAAKRFTGKMTGSESDIDTAFLEQHDNLILTSGDAARGITGAKFKGQFKDLKDFNWVVLAASRGIENGKLIFERFEHFLDPSNPIPLGEIAKLEVSMAKDLFCNSIKTGWPVKEIDEVNGKLSFNNTFSWSTPLYLEQPKVLDLIGPYITDPYYQEIIRINNDGKTTTDDKSDNEILAYNCEKQSEVFTGTDILIDTATDGNYFFINSADDKIDLFKTKFTVSGTVSNDGTYTVKKVVKATSGFNVFVNENIVTEVVSSAQFTIEYYIPYRPVYTSITGIPDPATIYNIEEFTPKRILLKHSKWIDSIFYGFTGQKIKYESTEKNSDLETVRSGVTIKERATYTIGTDILFKPYYFEFDTIVPNDLIEDLDGNINRCFSFEWYGDTYKGFLRKVGASVNDNKPQQFRLLCTPDTDVTKLIF